MNVKTEERLSYVDAIKGFAIILMVLGHVLATTFSDWHLMDQRPALSYLKHLIYSFHMPLLMLMSGFLFGRKPISGWTSYVQVVAKKGVQLLIPYLFVGLLLYISRGCKGAHFNYWYLMTLFQLIVIMGAVDLVVHRWMPQKKDRMFVLLSIVFFVLLLYAQCIEQMVVRQVPPFRYVRIGSIVYMFPFFVVGILTARYGILERFVGVDTLCVCLMSWFFMFFLKPFPHLSFTRWLAVVGFVSLFRLYFKHGRLMSVVRYCGKMSLSIYIFHFFLNDLIKFPAIGQFYVEIVDKFGERVGGWLCVPIQFVYCFAWTVIIITLCLGCEYVVSRIPIIRTLFLGKK